MTRGEKLTFARLRRPPLQSAAREGVGGQSDDCGEANEYVARFGRFNCGEESSSKDDEEAEQDNSRAGFG